MSTGEQMVYLEGEQSLRNKDYITITRSEYFSLLQIKEYARETRLAEGRIKTNRQCLEDYERRLKKREQEFVFQVHKKVKEMAAEILKIQLPSEKTTKPTTER